MLNLTQTMVGGGAGIRTPDTANMSRMLYHLSYTAARKVQTEAQQVQRNKKIQNKRD